MESDSHLGENFDGPKEVCLSEEGYTCHKNGCSDEQPSGECSKNEQAPTYVCDVCSKSYVSSKGLKSHKLNYHSGCLCNELDSRGNPRVCRVCPSLLKMDDSEKTHICGICSKGYSTKKSLRSHYLVIHEGKTKPKNFDCPFCSRSFVSDSALERHLVSHTGVKPFTCTVCGKGLVSRFVLQKHFRIHEREQDDFKPHTCEICKKTFPSKSQRNLHYRSHQKPFSCDQCLESFTDKHILADHKKSFHKKSSKNV